MGWAWELDRRKLLVLRSTRVNNNKSIYPILVKLPNSHKLRRKVLNQAVQVKAHLQTCLISRLRRDYFPTFPLCKIHRMLKHCSSTNPRYLRLRRRQRLYCGRERFHLRRWLRCNSYYSINGNNMLRLKRRKLTIKLSSNNSSDNPNRAHLNPSNCSQPLPRRLPRPRVARDLRMEVIR